MFSKSVAILINSQSIYENYFLKNTFSKLLLHKRYFQNCSFKNDIFKVATLKRDFQNYFIKIASLNKALSWYLVIIYSSSESSEELSKLSVIYI